MVSKEEAVPCLALKLRLPCCHDAFEIFERYAFVRPFAVCSACQLNQLELEYHAELFAVCGCIFFCLLDRDTGTLTDRHQIIFGKDFLVHLLQILMNMRSVYAAGVTVESAFRNLSIRQSFRLGDHADDIHTEAVDAFLAPPVHHIENFFSYGRVFPVQVRLLRGKQMQVIHLGLRIVFPCGAGEAASPVVWLFSLFCITPDVIVAVRVFFRFAALHEPFVFV